MIQPPIIEQVTLEQLVAESKRLSIWTYVGTANQNGRPFVTPVHPGWEGETLWTMIEVDSAKAKNIAVNSEVCCHWPVSEETGMDSLILWGVGEIDSSIETKKRLWNGVFDYDLAIWAPNGPEQCPDKAFLKITPAKVILLKNYGAEGRFEWFAASEKVS